MSERSENTQGDSSNDNRKLPKRVTYMYQVRKELDEINKSIEETVNNNRRIRLESHGCFVKIYKKPAKLKETFGRAAIIDPDLVIYIDDDLFEKGARVVQDINHMLKSMDLSTYEKILKSASTIRKSLISGFDRLGIEYIFI